MVYVVIVIFVGVMCGLGYLKGKSSKTGGVQNWP